MSYDVKGIHLPAGWVLPQACREKNCKEVHVKIPDVGFGLHVNTHYITDTLVLSLFYKVKAVICIWEETRAWRVSEDGRSLVPGVILVQKTEEKHILFRKDSIQILFGKGGFRYPSDNIGS